MKITIKKYLPKYYTATATFKNSPIIANGFGATHTKALNDLMATINSLSIKTIKL